MRGFCHTFCWMAPFMIIGGKLGSLLSIRVIRLKADKDKCINCKICTRNCVMSLPVDAMVKNNKMNHTECILCGACIDNCPKKAISFETGLKLIIGSKTINKVQ
jgi:ferredoxin